MLSLSLIALTVGANPSFQSDLSFIKSFAHVIVLKNGTGAEVAVVPQWQARVMTSTYDARHGMSMGFVNYSLLKSRKVTPHIYPIGGEDRIWFGPEGGQFSLFFKHGAPFDLAHWYTPAPVDTQPWEIAGYTRDSVDCFKKLSLTNYSNTTFDLTARRQVKLLGKAEAERDLGVAIPSGVSFVGFQTRNQVTNTGSEAWTEQSGLISIWILAMLKHSPTTTAIVPFKPGPVSTMGPKVNDTYFGKVPADRLRVTDRAAYFKCDGKMRTKIGVNAFRARDVVGSYDPRRHLLTIMKFSRPDTRRYVNSMWELQPKPFAGDVANAYNDGVPSPGAKPLGPFYEIEDSSPALSLSPGETAVHVSRTFHFHGSDAKLRALGKKILGVPV